METNSHVQFYIFLFNFNSKIKISIYREKYDGERVDLLGQNDTYFLVFFLL